MKSDSHIAELSQLIENASVSLSEARAILQGMLGNDSPIVQDMARIVPPREAVIEGRQTIVEGYFDGQKMIDGEGKTYSIPSNYASKSKLVEGDLLKLTIKEDGSFLYKQIGPIERARVRGMLHFDDESGQFRVLGEGKSYKVLTASVTYFKGRAGDEVILLVPKDRSCMWGAVENIISSSGGGSGNEGFAHESMDFSGSIHNESQEDDHSFPSSLRQDTGLFQE